MKRLVLVFALVALAACTSDSSLPTPTGKGTLRAINAIPASPAIEFRIEQRPLGTVSHRESTAAARFDDFDYTFNFLALLAGDSQASVVESTTLTVEAGVDYSFVLTGNLSAPDVTIWESAERDWDGSETVFEPRFAHTSPSTAAIDVYFAPEGIAPVVGEERGTLNFGEILPASDLQEGDYVMTVTSAGDATDILYQSEPTTFAAQTALIFSIFDPDGQDTGQIVARIINSAGAASPLPDVTAPPTVRFIQASQDLSNADVYDDEMLVNRILNDHAYTNFTDDLEFAPGTTSLSYTTVGDTSAILFESGIATVAGIRYNFIVIGREGERFGQTVVPDRRSISTIAKIRPYHAAFNNQDVDIYIVESGTTVDEEQPVVRGADYSLVLPSIPVVAGNYDIYLTLPNEKTIVGGPLAVAVGFGDIVEILFFDAVDPAIVDMQIIPPSP